MNRKMKETMDRQNVTDVHYRINKITECNTGHTYLDKNVIALPTITRIIRMKCQMTICSLHNLHSRVLTNSYRTNKHITVIMLSPLAKFRRG